MRLDDKFLNKNKKIKIFISYQFLMFFISLILYHNIFLAYLMSFSFMIFYKRIIHEENEKEKSKIIYEFKEFLNLLSIAVVTGDEPVKGFILAYDEYEKINNNVIFLNALRESYNYIKVYGDFINGIKLLSNKLDIEAVRKFYESINVAYKTYGNINEVLENTIDIISKKIETENEIKNLFYEKKYEMKIMLVIPILIYLFLSLTASEFVNPIYDSITGYFVLTFCLGLLILAYVLGEKILDVDID